QLAAAYAIQRRLGRTDERTASITRELGRSLHHHGRHDDALRLLDEALTLWRTLYSADHWRAGETMALMGDVLHTRAELGTAETYLRAATGILRSALGEASPTLAQARRDLANVLRDRGAYAEAEPLYRASLASLVQQRGELDAG